VVTPSAERHWSLCGHALPPHGGSFARSNNRQPKAFGQTYRTMTDKRTPTSHPIRELLTFWDTRYQEAHHHRYPFSGGKDSKMMKDLREFYSDEQIRSFMAAFFEMDDPFIEQSGHSLGVFRGCLPKVIQFIQRGPAQPKRETPKNLQGVEEWLRRKAGA
jgi:hypothetical protein